MPCFSRVEYCDVHFVKDFVMTMQMLLSKNIEDVTRKGEFRLETYSHVIIRHCVTMVVF